MAEPFREQLSRLVEGHPLQREPRVHLEVRHFFSGAALYANGKICASLSPAGLALKLPQDARQALISEGKGEKFRFFPQGPIKREYVLLERSVAGDKIQLQRLLRACVGYIVGLPNSTQ